MKGALDHLKSLFPDDPGERGVGMEHELEADAAQLADDGGSRRPGVYPGADGAFLDALGDVAAEHGAEYRVALGEDRAR